jgi:transcriptional regulator with XRE-family HTH domain
MPNLRTLRRLVGLSQTQLGVDSGVSQKMISRLELGTVAHPSYATVTRICRVLQCRPERVVEFRSRRVSIPIGANMTNQSRKQDVFEDSSHTATRQRKRLTVEEKKRLGRRIRALRQRDKRNLTQQRLAELVELDPASLNQIEKGHRAPDIVTVKALAAHLGVPPSAIIDDNDNVPAPSVRPQSPDKELRSDVQLSEIQRAVSAGVRDAFADIVLRLVEVVATRPR